MLCANVAKLTSAPRYSVVLSKWPKTNLHIGEEATPEVKASSLFLSSILLLSFHSAFGFEQAFRRLTDSTFSLPWFIEVSLI
jgi:hypothetical protein